MTKTTMPDKFRYRSDGQPFRRLFIYISQKKGFVSEIEMCEPSAASSVKTRATCDLIGSIDVFQDGSVLLTINHERTDYAFYEFANEFPSLTPVNIERDDGLYFFDHPDDKTRFLIMCGSKNNSA